MSKMIQIRNVDDDTHQTLKIRAVKAGMSLSDYLKLKLEAIIERPTVEELIAAIHSQPAVTLEPSPAELIRQERDSR